MDSRRWAAVAAYSSHQVVGVSVHDSEAGNEAAEISGLFLERTSVRSRCSASEEFPTSQNSCGHVRSVFLSPETHNQAIWEANEITAAGSTGEFRTAPVKEQRGRSAPFNHGRDFQPPGIQPACRNAITPRWYFHRHWTASRSTIREPLDQLSRLIVNLVRRMNLDVRVCTFWLCHGVDEQSTVRRLRRRMDRGRSDRLADHCGPWHDTS
jgi:hypothetical protein